METLESESRGTTASCLFFPAPSALSPSKKCFRFHFRFFVLFSFRSALFLFFRSGLLTIPRMTTDHFKQIKPGPRKCLSCLRIEKRRRETEGARGEAQKWWSHSIDPSSSPLACSSSSKTKYSTPPLPPGPADEPNGASDILAFFNLRRLHDLTQSGTFVRQQQEQARQQGQQQGGGFGVGGGGGIPGDTRLWKRGPATGLAPLASKPAPSIPAGSRPRLLAAPLARSLASLESGGPWSLGDGERGELVAEGSGEESAAVVLLPVTGRGGATAAAAAAAAPQQALSPPAPAGAGAGAGAAAASPAKPKIKLKVKFGGGAKKS